MTFRLDPIPGTGARRPAPRSDLGMLATILGGIPFGWLLSRAPEMTCPDLPHGEPISGLYPSVDATTMRAIRAGVRVGNW